jgi:RNA polymerase sigma-70 factor (ECF subfamily)
LQDRKLYTAEDYFLLFQQGEEQGFNYFFGKLYEPLVHFAFTFLNDKSEAEDIVEDSFVKFWQRRAEIERAGAVKSYLYTIVRNACLDVITRKKYARSYVLHIERSPESFTPDVQHKIIISESMHQVYLALKTLPPKCRQVFTMLYVQGKPVKEIAEELQLSVSTVKSHKATALKLLRKQLPHLGCLLFMMLFAGSSSFTISSVLITGFMS